MQVVEELPTEASGTVLFAAVSDLGTYSQWLTIVPKAEPAAADPGDPGPAWSVDLRGRLGPFARSKRLRMVRSEFDEPRHVRFERRELDGRNHSAWVLDAQVLDEPGGARLVMTLDYGGNRWMPVLDRLLHQEIERSKPQLLAIL